jgi:hypothetical protein
MKARPNLYWGDFHCHLEDVERADLYLEEARRNLDVYPVLCYPFAKLDQKGLRVESVRQRPEFREAWRALRAAARRFHEPGRFVTYLAYEWHGNRTRYGDHNVIWFDDDGPLDDTWSLPALFRKLRRRRSLAIPHHTGYQPGIRGKDWDVHDENLSPVTEIYSWHGSSEGPDTPLPLRANGSMGPRVSGGTWHDGLARGYRLGCIASNDGPGLAGRWGDGLAALWADDLTREGIWEALKARRTYAVTGDRIRLWLDANGGHPMGSVLPRAGELDLRVEVEGLHALDRVELVRNNRVLDTWCHGGKWEAGAVGGRFKVRVEAGWGPATYYGFPHEMHRLDLALRVEGGRLLGCQPCFNKIGQRVLGADARSCRWRLSVPSRATNAGWKDHCQSVVFDVAGGPSSRLALEMNGRRFALKARDALEGSHLFRLAGDSAGRIRKVFGLPSRGLWNVDPLLFNAHKLKVHLAAPEAAFRASVRFRDRKVPKGRNWYYVRVTQTNGQMAWSSPVWLRA